MKKIVILILICQFSYAYSQKENIDNNWSRRKVVEKDSMDIRLNMLIEKNEILEFRELSFKKENREWRPGKIYLLNGDTLSGEIKNKKYKEGAATVRVYYRKDNQSPKINFRADKVLGYCSNNREYFSKKFSYFPPCFIERLEQGELNLYYVKFEEFRGWKSNGIVIAKLKNDFYIESNDSLHNTLSGPIPEKSKDFKEFISNFIFDYPELLAKVRNDIYIEENIREIIQMYNTHKQN
jgi:hypothetical protein